MPGFLRHRKLGSTTGRGQGALSIGLLVVILLAMGVPSLSAQGTLQQGLTEAYLLDGNAIGGETTADAVASAAAAETSETESEVEAALSTPASTEETEEPVDDSDLVISEQEVKEANGRASTDQVELLLAEDLFPQLRPILLKAAGQAPSVLSRNVESAIAEANAVIANSDRYPSVGGLLRYDYRREDRIDRPDIQNSNKLYYFFQAKYPIYHWGAVKAASEIGEIGVQLAGGQTELAYRQVVQSIRSQYLNLVIQKMDLANMQNDLDTRRDELSFQKERLKLGEISTNRIGSLDFNLREAQLGFDRLVSEYQFSVRQFGRLIGDEAFTDASIAGAFPEIGYNSDQLAELLSKFADGGFVEDPRVAEAELEIEREKNIFRIQNVRNRPKLNLTTGITQDEINYDANIANKYQTTALFAGISVDWSIFDGFETRGLKRASLLRLNRLRMARQELDGIVIDEANQAAERVRFSVEALKLGEIRLSGTRGSLKLAENDFEAGLTSEESVEAARRRIRDTEIALARRKADYLNALSAFVSQVGADSMVDEWDDNRPDLGPEYNKKP